MCKIVKNGIAVIHSDEPIVTDVQSALDLAVRTRYETGCSDIAINKEAFSEAFFSLRTCLAGEILQKYINYGFRLAIYGDFSGYTSKSLQDFIYESNKGKDIFFQPDCDSAVEKLIER